MKLKGVGLFALGTLFGLEGIKLLSSKDAKKIYTHCTAGVMPPATSAMLHNGSTVAIGLKSMTHLLGAKDNRSETIENG